MACRICPYHSGLVSRRSRSPPPPPGEWVQTWLQARSTVSPLPHQLQLRRLSRGMMPLAASGIHPPGAARAGSFEDVGSSGEKRPGNAWTEGRGVCGDSVKFGCRPAGASPARPKSSPTGRIPGTATNGASLRWDSIHLLPASVPPAATRGILHHLGAISSASANPYSTAPSTPITGADTRATTTTRRCLPRNGHRRHRDGVVSFP